MLHISNVISKHLKKNFDYLQFTHLEKIFHADENLKMTFLIVSYFSNVCTLKKIKKKLFFGHLTKKELIINCIFDTQLLNSHKRIINYSLECFLASLDRRPA